MKDFFSKFAFSFALVVLSVPVFYFVSKSLAYVILGCSLIFAIVVSCKKGGIKRIDLKKLTIDFYNLEIKKLFLESSDWIKYNLSLSEIDKDQIPLYMSMRLKDVELISPFNEERKKIVNTLKEYQKYIEWGYYPYTTISMLIASEYDIILVFFRLLKKAKPSLRKTIGLKKIILNLPADFLCFIAPPDEREEFKGLLINEYLKKYDSSVNKKNKTIELIVTYDNSCEFYSFSEVLRADFFNKGYEEILLAEYYKSAGTFQIEQPLLIRLIEKGQYQIIDIPDNIKFRTKFIRFVSDSKYMTPIKKLLSLFL